MKRSTQDEISFCRRHAPWLTGGVLSLLAVSLLIAEGPREEPATEVSATSGWRAYVDPETGELNSVPSREQVEALTKSPERTIRRSSEGLEPFELSLGGRGVHLRGRFQSALVVHIDADGGLELACVDEADDLARHLPEEDRGEKSRWVEK